MATDLSAQGRGPGRVWDGVCRARTTIISRLKSLLVTRCQGHGTMVVIAWACFTLMVVLVVHHHEPWFDEAQAWLIARDNSPFEILFRRMRYEGSPGLWHLLLWVLVRSGAPFRAMSYLSALLASVTAGLILLFAPFPVWLRVLFVFGYFPAYQYAVVARSYGLNLLLLTLAAILYSSRCSHPVRYGLILAALANTNVFGFLAAGVIFLDCAFSMSRSLMASKKSNAMGALIFVVASLLAIVQALPARDVSFPRPHKTTAVSVISTAIGQISRGFVEFGPATPNKMMIGFLLSVGALAVGFRLAAKGKKLALSISLCAVPLAFQALKYCSPWHAGLIYLSWVFGLWVSWATFDDLRVRFQRVVVLTIAFVFVVQGYDALAAWRLDLSNSYSAAPEAAKFLRSYFALHSDVKLACVGDWAFAVQPYFKQNICANYYGGAPKPSYYDWKLGDPYPDRPDAHYVAKLMETGEFDALLVCGFALRDRASEVVIPGVDYSLVRSFQGTTIWKDYFGFTDDLFLFEKRRTSLASALAKPE